MGRMKVVLLTPYHRVLRWRAGSRALRLAARNVNAPVTWAKGTQTDSGRAGGSGNALCGSRELSSSPRRVPNFTPSFAGRAERATRPGVTQRQQRLAQGVAVQGLPHGVPSGAPRTLMGATSVTVPAACRKV